MELNMNKIIALICITFSFNFCSLKSADALDDLLKKEGHRVLDPHARKDLHAEPACTTRPRVDSTDKLYRDLVVAGTIKFSRPPKPLPPTPPHAKRHLVEPLAPEAKTGGSDLLAARRRHAAARKAHEAKMRTMQAAEDAE